MDGVDSAPMKKQTIAAFASLALLGFFPACDSHSWEDSEDGEKGSKHLFKPHGGGHGDGHDKDGGKEHAGGDDSDHKE